MRVTVPDYRVLSKVSLPAKKTGLLVADMLLDFVSPGGRLFVPATQKTIAPLRSLVEKARTAGALIVYIQDWHRPDDPEFSIWGPMPFRTPKGQRSSPN
jgi:nicotinamidase-related amidase